MKITANVTKSSHEDRDPRYLHLKIFFLHIHSPLLLENKKLFRSLLSSGIRPQTTVHILQDYSTVRIGFNLINKRPTQPIDFNYTMLVKIY